MWNDIQYVLSRMFLHGYICCKTCITEPFLMPQFKCINKTRFYIDLVRFLHTQKIIPNVLPKLLSSFVFIKEMFKNTKKIHVCWLIH